MATHPNMTAAGQFSETQHEKLKVGAHKGQWVGMTKEKLQAIMG